MSSTIKRTGNTTEHNVTKQVTLKRHTKSKTSKFIKLQSNFSKLRTNLDSMYNQHTDMDTKFTNLHAMFKFTNLQFKLDAMFKQQTELVADFNKLNAMYLYKHTHTSANKHFHPRTQVTNVTSWATVVHRTRPCPGTTRTYD